MITITNQKHKEIIENNLSASMRRIFESYAPPVVPKTRDWANKYRYFSPDEGAQRGRYKTSMMPYLDWKGSPLDALDDPKVVELVCQKSAQVAWTTGVLGNYLALCIVHNPSPMMVLFAKEGAANEWSRLKLEPMIKATPVLREKIRLNSRADGNTLTRKHFIGGGYLMLAGSNSPASVKGKTIRVMGVEEPDDCNINVKKQGDAITLAKERTKMLYPDVKLIIGGTPTVKDFSIIEKEMKISDMRVGMVTCHECDQASPLSFENFFIPDLKDTDENTRAHPVYGFKDPAGAFYACPKCGCKWSFEQKNANMKRKGKCWFEATAPFDGVAGWYLNELFNPFAGSSFKILAEKQLVAEHELKGGDPSKMIAFINSQQGLPYEYKGDAVDAKDLEQYGIDYKLGTAPKGCLELYGGVDVQKDRLECYVRGFGANGKSWLVDHVKIFGDPTDAADKSWVELSKWLKKEWPCEEGYKLKLTMTSIDSSAFTETVYDFIHKNKRLAAMAVKGSSKESDPIFSLPKNVDYKKTPRGKGTKANDKGVLVYIVGIQYAKTHIDNQLKKVAKDTRQFFWPRECGDYLEQLTVEKWVPHKGKFRWVNPPGARNEANDCEVYILHAARSQSVHRRSVAEWELIKERLFNPVVHVFKAKEMTI